MLGRNQSGNRAGIRIRIHQLRAPYGWGQFYVLVLVPLLFSSSLALAQLAPLPPTPGGGLPREILSEQEIAAKEARLVVEVVEPELVMELDPRRSKILRTSSRVSRISVTNPEIVDVVEFSPMEFELIGGLSGETTLTFWFGEGQKMQFIRLQIC